MVYKDSIFGLISLGKEIIYQRLNAKQVGLDDMNCIYMLLFNVISLYLFCVFICLYLILKIIPKNSKHLACSVV